MNKRGVVPRNRRKGTGRRHTPHQCVFKRSRRLYKTREVLVHARHPRKGKKTGGGKKKGGGRKHPLNNQHRKETFVGRNGFAVAEKGGGWGLLIRPKKDLAIRSQKGRQHMAARSEGRLRIGDTGKTRGFKHQRLADMRAEGRDFNQKEKEKITCRTKITEKSHAFTVTKPDCCPYQGLTKEHPD